MFPTFPSLRAMLKGVLGNKEKQGHVVTGLAGLVDRLPGRIEADLTGQVEAAAPSGSGAAPGIAGI